MSRVRPSHQLLARALALAGWILWGGLPLAVSDPGNPSTAMLDPRARSAPLLDAGTSANPFASGPVALEFASGAGSPPSKPIRADSGDGLIPSRRLQPGTELRLGFWSLDRVDNSSRVREDVRRMARVLWPMDCVALGGIRDDRMLAKLVNELSILGGQWNKVRTAKRLGRRAATREFYALVYRSDRVEVRGRPRVLPRKQLTVPGVPYRVPFERPPMACSFVTLDGRFDFTALIVQVTAGKDVSWGQLRPSPTASALQAAELKAMADYFRSVQQSDASDQDVLLLGHLRRNVGDPELEPLLGIQGMVEAISDQTPTAIDAPTTFDHILLQPQHFNEWTGRSGVDPFEQDPVFQGDPANARRSCSGSRPVWITVTVPERDDD